MKNRAPSREFYISSPFRNEQFLGATILFAIDLVVILLAAIVALRHSSLGLLLWLALATCTVVPLWVQAFRIHQSIRILFESGQISALEKRSPLDAVLSANTVLLTNGMILSLIAVGMCMGALIELLYQHPFR